MIKHDVMVKALAKDGEIILAELKPSDAHLLHMCMGLSGELGELIDIIKKSIFYRKPLDLKHAKEEMGDVEFYFEGLRQGLGITREETITDNIKKLGARYEGFCYSDDAAKLRADKV